MLHISIVPSVQQTYFPLSEKLEILKTHPYYLSPPWGICPFPLPWVVEGHNNFDSSTIFLILHKFHIEGFAVIFFKGKLNVPHMVLS